MVMIEGIEPAKNDDKCKHIAMAVCKICKDFLPVALPMTYSSWIETIEPFEKKHRHAGDPVSPSKFEGWKPGEFRRKIVD